LPPKFFEPLAQLSIFLTVMISSAIPLGQEEAFVKKDVWVAASSAVLTLS